MDSPTSFTQLPKEIRLQIWTLAYFSQSPRLVTFRTKPHDENHNTDTFCPRFSPSHAPTVMNICHEARAEAIHKAKQAAHIVQLPVGSIDGPDPEVTEPFYFRFETDILYLPFDDPRPGHHDEEVRNGLPEHFKRVLGTNARALLRTVAITESGWSTSRNKTLFRSLCGFPSLSRIIIIISTGTRDAPVKRSAFVFMARNFVALYKMRSDQDTLEQVVQKERVDFEFATVDKGVMDIIPMSEWRDWSPIAERWVREATRYSSRSSDASVTFWSHFSVLWNWHTSNFCHFEYLIGNTATLNFGKW